MEFRHSCKHNHNPACKCGNLSARGSKATPMNIAGLSSSIKEKIHEYGGDILKIGQDSIRVRQPQEIEVTNTAIRCYRLICSACHTVWFIFTCDKKAYLQIPSSYEFDPREANGKFTSMLEYLPFQIRQFVDFSQETQPVAAVSLPGDDDLFIMHGSVDIDYDMMFGNYSECMIGALQDVTPDACDSSQS